MNIDDAINNFVECLEFDTLIAWAGILDVEVNYPPTDDMYPDWESELRVEVAEAMGKVGTVKEKR